MKRVLLPEAAKFNKNRKRRQSWQRVVRSLIMVVVFCTTYALILPAITMEQEPVCGMEAHTHTEDCYAVQPVVALACSLSGEQKVIHQHDAACYDASGALVCTLPEMAEHIHGSECYTQSECAEDHTHTEDCEQLTQICALEECQLHQHTAECYDAEGAVLCTMPEILSHVHGDACFAPTGETVSILTCSVEEHVHVESCYPVEESEPLGLEYRCGYAPHVHNESCYDAEGSQVCSIPEHVHVAGCVLEDLDLTADVEDAAKWEEMAGKLELTGNWSEDLLIVAKSQLGYQESAKNCVLVGEQLNGYTRYGDWFGNPYWDWDDMFVSFCLNYAEISEEAMPREFDTARWAEQLNGLGMFAKAEEYTPLAGDLVFLDTDEDEKADYVGIAAEQLSDSQLKIIAGNNEEGKVDYMTCDLTEDKILGYGMLPENPVPQEQWNRMEQLEQMLAELPSKESVLDALRGLNDAGDKAGYEALRQELAERIESILDVQESLDEEQKDQVEGLDQVKDLQDVCGGENWQELPALTDDGALLTGLTAEEPEVIPAADEETENQVAEAVSEYVVRNQDVIRFRFTAAAESYYTDIQYGEARVKVELVLPLTEDKARFLTDEMAWLEEAQLTTGERDGIACQILTGYKRMTGTESNAIAVPGSFTEAVPVEILNMAHGEMVHLSISAAMEHSAWDGLCQDHEVAEKITVQTRVYTLDDPLPEEERSETFDAFMEQIEALTAEDISADEKKIKANELLDQVVEAYYEGLLTSAELEKLGDALRDPLGYYAEYATGIDWMLGTGSGSEAAPMMRSFAMSRSVSVEQIQALSIETYSDVFASSQQIPEGKEGGGHGSTDGAVYVSKTIEGTDAENVFDITLQVITKDEVNEVYKEPDMAVVVVMDISNTMNSNIGGSDSGPSRYEAAMDAGQHFLENFAANNKGASKVGYVAFNTHAHEIFDLSTCSTAAQASALATEMRNDTRPIIKATGYADSANRFTNIEAGLQMAYDMLSKATNENKYIIFISDGFPTTYMTAAAGDGYTGYNPYTSGGTNGNNGVFYDAVQNEHCDYGTSYSDTAAIKARQTAVKLKAEGVNIFSIGVDVSGQNLWYYHNDSYLDRGSHSVFERREEASYYYEHGYEIGTKHGAFGKDRVTTDSIDDGQAALSESSVDKTAMAQDFKDWLKGTKDSGIGSGYYYDSTNLAGLESAYTQIFETIKELNAASAHLDWVAADPMGDMGVHDVDSVDFIGFYDQEGNLVANRGALVGESAEGAENTADFHTDENTIHWNLKESGYTSVAIDNVTQYRCQLKYRIRLKNEDVKFEEGMVYDTNDTTTLTYRIIDVTDGVTTISERRTIDFPIPAVEGYLSELNFRKTGPTGVSLAGAEFTLSHDPAACAACTDPGMTCAGEGISAVTIADQVATSDGEGMVSFTNIPSGHIYTLTETKVPEGYINNDNTYQVMISYDKQTVTVLDANGDPLEWTSTIENDMYYQLPETGGMGTSHLTYGGTLILCAGLMYICITGRKRRKEGR